MNIMFTGAGRRIELIQAFRNAALMLNKELKIYGADMTGTAPALAFCDHVCIVASMKDPGYIQNLLDICAKEHIDLIIPTIDTDLLVLSENREKFEKVGTKVLVSSPDKIKICRDKKNTSDFFVECGLNTPMIQNDWKKYSGGFPAFIKPDNGSSSINAFKINTLEELVVFTSKIDNYIIQPFISGREYSIDIFCDYNGEPVSIVPRERLQVRAGEVLKTKICMDNVMIEEMRILCKKLKPCGPINVQLIRDEDGVDWYIEINPRFGGGAPLSMKAGANSAEMVLKLIDGEEVNHITEVADGSVYSRFDQSVCITNNTRKFKGVIFDLDDTLYSEKEYVKSGFKVVSDYLGGGLEDKLWEYFESRKPAISELLNELERETEVDRVLEIYRSHKPNIYPYPGVKSMIKALYENGYKIGIITDGRPEGQRNKLNALGLDVNDVIITDELGGIQFRKPCDIAFRIMQTRWRLHPEEIVYVGDNPLKDFQAPRQLGMEVIYFRNADGLYSEYENDIYKEIDSLSGFHKLLLAGC